LETVDVMLRAGDMLKLLCGVKVFDCRGERVGVSLGYEYGRVINGQLSPSKGDAIDIDEAESIGLETLRVCGGVTADTISILPPLYRKLYRLRMDFLLICSSLSKFCCNLLEIDFVVVVKLSDRVLNVEFSADFDDESSL
jgi:hypothetical protein